MVLYSPEVFASANLIVFGLANVPAFIAHGIVKIKEAWVKSK
jgi:hypothetical protein